MTLVHPRERTVATRVVAVVASSLLVAACGSTALREPVSRDASAAPSESPPRETPGSPAPATEAGAPLDARSPPPVLRFAAVGDTGKGTPGQQKVADAIAAKCAKDGCDFVQLLGDNIYESGVDSVSDPLFQTRFELPYANVRAPFWVVLGNHDYGGGGAGTSFERGQFEVDYSAISSKWRLPAHFWHRAQHNVEMFGLDTNLILFGRDADQRAQVPTWIAASVATWKLAFGHHPYLSNGPHGNASAYEGVPGLPVVSGDAFKDFMAAYVCGKVDLYLCGHEHSSQWLTETCRGTELVVAGAGAEGTALTTRNESRFQTNVLSFLYVVIEGKRLTADIVDELGNVVFTRSLRKY